MKKKNIYIIIAAGVGLILIIALAFILFPAKKNSPLPGAVNAYQPEFLTSVEKQSLGLPLDAKVQAFRDAKGGLEVYKIIKNDSEIVSDPSRVGPISPRQK